MSTHKSPAEVQVEVDNVEASTLSMEEPTVDHKALLRKIDFKVLPMLFLIYVAAFLDRCVRTTLGLVSQTILTSDAVSTSPMLLHSASRKTFTLRGIKGTLLLQSSLCHMCFLRYPPTICSSISSHTFGVSAMQGNFGAA